jgi:hypothetical protein
VKLARNTKLGERENTSVRVRSARPAHSEIGEDTKLAERENTGMRVCIVQTSGTT